MSETRANCIMQRRSHFEPKKSIYHTVSKSDHHASNLEVAHASNDNGNQFSAMVATYLPL